MTSLGYLWAATAVVWLGTLAYIASLLRRQTRLEQQLRLFEQRLQRRDRD